MRGRKPRSLTISAADRPILEFVAHDRRLAWFQVQHARIILAIAAGERVGDLATRLECDRTTIWRVCRRYEQGGLKQLLQDDPRRDIRWRFPPSNVPRSSNSLAWDPSLRDCTSPTGQARIWLAKPLRTTSLRRSVPPRSVASCNGSICNRTAHAIGGPRSWTNGSRNGPRRCCGATATPSDWHAKASGSSAPTRFPTFRYWSECRSAGPFPATSNTKSLSTPGTERSICCCFWQCTAVRWT